MHFGLLSVNAIHSTSSFRFILSEECETLETQKSSQNMASFRLGCWFCAIVSRTGLMNAENFARCSSTEGVVSKKGKCFWIRSSSSNKRRRVLPRLRDPSMCMTNLMQEQTVNKVMPGSCSIQVNFRVSPSPYRPVIHLLNAHLYRTYTYVGRDLLFCSPHRY